MRKTRTLDRNYFEGLYAACDDPWGFETSPYEQEKYARTLEALGRERVKQALEVGCSIGVLTQRLGERCDHLTATDLSPSALKAASARCAAVRNISFRLVSSAAESFEGRFDLIVLSEVVYYWDRTDLAIVATAIERSLADGGRLLLVHWLGETDYPMSGDEAVSALWSRLASPYLIERTERTADYRLDLWRRCAKARRASRA